MESTWENRDLPVLDAIVQIYDDKGVVTARQLEEATGFDSEIVQTALRVLRNEEPPFFEIGPMRGGRFGTLAYVSGHARRAVGAWPTPDSLADRIVESLDQAAADATSDEEKSRLQQASETLGGVGRGVMTGVLTHVLTGGM